MNLSQINERNIVIELLRKDLGDNIYTRKAYSYYRADFVRYFAKQEVEDAPLLYRASFAELLSELAENRANLLGSGSILSLLLLIAWNKLRTKENSVFPDQIKSSEYKDIELLVYFLQEPKKYPLAEFYLVEKLKLSCENVLKSKIKLSEVGSDAIVEELINDALNITLKHIQTGRFKPPLTATIFTYCYGVLSNKIRDWNKSAKKRQQLTQEELPTFLPDAPPKDTSWLIEKYQRHYTSLQRYDFEDTTVFVEFLLSKMDDTCRKVIHLFYMETKSHSEIEDLLGIPNAKSKAHYCKVQLRNLLEAANNG